MNHQESRNDTLSGLQYPSAALIASTMPSNQLDDLQATSQLPSDAGLPMVSRQVPAGIVRQSWDFIGNDFAPGSDPLQEDDMEPHAVFPPDM